MRQEPIDVVEALAILVELMELSDAPENQPQLDEITGMIVTLIPDYLAVYPEKKQAVLAVLNRSYGIQVSSLNEALDWYSKQPAAATPKPSPPQPETAVEETKPAVTRPRRSQSPTERAQSKGRVQKKSPPSTPESTGAAAPPKPVLADRFKQWFFKKPEAPSITISNADEKRAELLKKLEAMRDGQNPFS